MKREVNFFPIGSRLSIDLPPPRAVPVEFLNPAFRDYIMTLTRGCCVLSCRISKSLSSNKKMRMKSKIFTSFLLAAVLLSGCKKDDPAPDKATLSVSPQTAIAFTAAATETFTVKVVTNQPTWKAESSQSWCKVAAGEGQFTVSADPNTSETAPTPGGDYGDGRE